MVEMVTVSVPQSPLPPLRPPGGLGPTFYLCCFCQWRVGGVGHVLCLSLDVVILRVTHTVACPHIFSFISELCPDS